MSSENFRESSTANIENELTKRYIGGGSEKNQEEEISSVQDKQYNQAITQSIEGEEPLVEKFENANEQMAAIDQTLEEKCAETFAKLPKYTETLVKIRANLLVLAGNAKRLKELSAEVAKECDVDVSKVVGKNNAEK